jgi:Tol biopolymer transport system component
VLVVALSGCSFSHGSSPVDARGGDAPEVPRDAPGDTPPANTCHDRWLAGTIRFGSPVSLAEVNSAVDDRDPFLTADERTLYLSSKRGSYGDIWVAKRSAITDPFEAPIEASEFNSTSFESKLSISADGKIAVVGSDRPGSSGIDVWESIRLAVTDPWPAMNRTNVMMLESIGSDHDPTLSADGQRIYFAPDTPAPQRIVVATRGANGMFGAPVALSELSGGTGDADPSPAPDERILVFTSSRPLSGAGNGDLWYATRASATATFDAPRPVPDVNTMASEGDPHLSSDGCRIYFARYVTGSDWDLFVATAL